MSFIKGDTCKWFDILKALNAENGPVFYLLYRCGTTDIVSACLNISMNPRAPYEIIPANKPLIRKRADEFAKLKPPVTP